MRILVACDKFKGSLTATEVCEAIAQGLWEANPGMVVDRVPIADGGEGFSETMMHALGGEWVECVASDALGKIREVKYALCGHVAVIEMAAAAGLAMLEEGDRDIWAASTFGVGMMMRHAVREMGATKLVIGLGGSATNDGGVGMAAALGIKFLDSDGNELEPNPRELLRLDRIDESGVIDLPEVLVACDVENPLLGARGASAVYGPQKGASPEDVVQLDEALAQLVYAADAAKLSTIPGVGAAGGMGFGLMRFAGGKLVKGFELVAKELRLEERIQEADLVITGEGSLDAQTEEGKGPAGIAKLAKEAGKPVIAIAGRVEDGAEKMFDQCLSLCSLGLGPSECMARAAELVRGRARELAGM
ncbi:glycerate kinase [Rubritalea halochordaticola]|uniref:glycerate kinase n=1 Tax=Rubritalea halochordaticola TaxID=714537 RepID=UPI0031FBBADF